jgi:hypothetical protein
MIFALLTLLTALSLAAVAGWFSIIGIMAIYAGAPLHALVMGAVLEAGKLVTTSWLYRNWDYAGWRLKIPLIFFIAALMFATSIGVFGFLSKAHLEQTASTLDNSAKVERLDQQIAREKSIIADNERVITQLDSTVNSYIGKDRTDKSVRVRKSQDAQRAQLRADINTAQKQIDTFSDEKLKLESEVRKLQLEVGPIRYIAEMIYGVTDNATKNIESAVQMFTLLIVSSLDPLAVILLVAANQTILRIQNEKKNRKTDAEIPVPSTAQAQDNEPTRSQKVEDSTKIFEDQPQAVPEIPPSQEIQDINEIPLSPVQVINTPADDIQIPVMPDITEQVTKQMATPIIRQPKPSRIIFEDPVDPLVDIKPWMQQETTLRELLGTVPVRNKQTKTLKNQDTTPANEELDKYPKALSWLTEFKRSDNE